MSEPPAEPLPSDAPFLDYASPPEKPRTGMAITALVLGILSLCCPPLAVPLGVPALVLGIIALVRAGRQPLRHGGKGLAIGGICTGGGAILLLLPLMIAILLPSLARAREIAKRSVCGSNLRGVGQGIRVYANDYDSSFPAGFQMLIDEGLSISGHFVCPCSGSTLPACDYYYVANLTEDDPGTWILAFEDPSNHGGEGAHVLYLDAHVNFEIAPQFTQILDQFKVDYEETRGEPPTIIPPGPLALPPDATTGP